MGRTKQTDDEKKQKGTRNRTPVEQVIQRDEPKKPHYMSKDAKAVWDRVVPNLVKKNMVTLEDSDLLAQYCVALSKYEEYSVFLAKNGDFIVHEHNGTKTKREEVKICREWSKEVTRLGELFGLSPKSRKAIGITAKSKEKGSGLKDKAHILSRRT